MYKNRQNLGKIGKNGVCHADFLLLFPVTEVLPACF